MIPIVETSVAVAMPSITAPRIRNGSRMAGEAMAAERPISSQVARRTPVRSS